jgi:hypothetical protein
MGKDGASVQQAQPALGLEQAGIAIRMKPVPLAQNTEHGVCITIGNGQ